MSAHAVAAGAATAAGPSTAVQGQGAASSTAAASGLRRPSLATLPETAATLINEAIKNADPVWHADDGGSSDGNTIATITLVVQPLSLEGVPSEDQLLGDTYINICVSFSPGKPTDWPTGLYVGFTPKLKPGLTKKWHLCEQPVHTFRRDGEKHGRVHFSGALHVEYQPHADADGDSPLPESPGWGAGAGGGGWGMGFQNAFRLFVE